MDTAFTHLLAMLGGIADPRRAEGKLYGLPHVFLFSILAVMAGANSYRAIHSFIDVHLHRLKETFELNWRRAPAYPGRRLWHAYPTLGSARALAIRIPLG